MHLQSGAQNLDLAVLVAQTGVGASDHHIDGDTVHSA